MLLETHVNSTLRFRQIWGFGIWLNRNDMIELNPNMPERLFVCEWRHSGFKKKD